MNKDTKPIFIIGSGRNGTRTIFRMLTGTEGVEIHHEFVCTHVQKLAALYYMGLVDKEEAKRQLGELHGSALYNTNDRVWIDSSNKLSWLIEPLLEMYPDSKFLVIMRDGRKVVSSFYYKLRDEMYDDRSVAVLQNWLANREKLPPPPPEKKYWWNIPQPGQPWHEEFNQFDRLQRTAYHWAECNRFILEKFNRVPQAQKMVVHLEEIVQDEDLLKSTIKFLEIEYDDIYLEYLKTPRNVFFPLDMQLTPEQMKKFEEICSPMMRQLGYLEKPVYVVNY